MTDRTSFNPGTPYRALDGRQLFVMSGNSQTVDVWQLVRIGERVRVGEMTRAAFADLLGRP